MTDRSCEDTRRRLALGERAEVTRHLAACAACRLEAERLQSVLSAIAVDAELAPPERLDTEIRRLLLSTSSRPVLRPVLALGLAVAGILALVTALGGALAAAGGAEEGLILVVSLAATYLAVSSAAAVPLLLCFRRQHSLLAQEVSS